MLESVNMAGTCNKYTHKTTATELGSPYITAFLRDLPVSQLACTQSQFSPLSR